MSAEFKSNILSRDEKGFFGVPLKRLLLAAVCGGLSYTFIQMIARHLSIPFGITFALTVLVLTAMRGGLPLWQRLLYRLRGSLLLTAVRYPNSLSAQLADLLDLPTQLVRLNGQEVFASAAEVQLDMSEWITFAQAEDADREDGLIFTDTSGGVDAQ